MNPKICSYCSQFSALTRSDIFCSKYNPDTSHLQNNLFHVDGQKVYSQKHISRYSLRYSFKGHQHFLIDGYHRTIGPKSVLFLEEGMSFTTDSFAGTNVELMTVAFNPLFFEGTLQLARKSHDEMLDNPVTKLLLETSNLPVESGDQVISMLFDLRKFVDLKYRTNEFDRKLEALILTLFRLTNNRTETALQGLNTLKASTKRELFKRLTIGRDYLTSCLQDDVKIEMVCKEVGMSKYHFIRSFNDLFGTTPHQFLKKERIDFAATLLVDNNLDIAEIASKSGYESPSSFTRAFKQVYGKLPSELQKIA